MIIIERYKSGRMHLRYEVNDLGGKDGLYEEWYATGQLACRATYGQGFLEGLKEEWTPAGVLQSRVVYDFGYPAYRKHIAKCHISEPEKIAIEYYQPVETSSGWCQLGEDGLPLFTEDSPLGRTDEVYRLAQELAPALRKSLLSVGVDEPDRYMLILPEGEIARPSLFGGEDIKSNSPIYNVSGGSRPRATREGKYLYK